MKKLHFCGGLPRSGSTVLMNILQQNPRIFTTGTCVLPQILHSNVIIKGRYHESFQAMSAEQADSAMYGLIHGATQGWYSGLTTKPVVISKNRSWNELYHLYPESKYIVMIRDIRDIVDSFVRLNSKIKALHAYGDVHTLLPAMDDDDLFQHFFKEQNALSLSLRNEVPRLMNKFRQNNTNILFVRYEDFVRNPKYILDKIYIFLEENNYLHDLNTIPQSFMIEHDNAYFREKTSHKTNSEFLLDYFPERVISEVMQNRIVKEHKWFYDGFYPEHT